MYKYILENNGKVGESTGKVLCACRNPGYQNVKPLCILLQQEVIH